MEDYEKKGDSTRRIALEIMYINYLPAEGISKFAEVAKLFFMQVLSEIVYKTGLHH